MKLYDRTLEKKSYVYIIRNNVNKKVYVGLTTGEVHRRFIGHLTSARRGRNSKLYDAMRKIGLAHFWYEVAGSTTCRNRLVNKERALIVKHDSINNGYNTNKGGTFGGGVGIPVTHKGIIYPTHQALADKIGITLTTLCSRRNKGLPLDDPKGTRWGKELKK